MKYEESAEFKENITGWVCKKCKRFWGNDSYSEHGARRCCATDIKCEKCDNRVTEKHRILCDSCVKKYDEKRYEERLSRAETVKWNGEPFVVNDELYLKINDYLEDCNGNKIEPLKFIFNSVITSIIPHVDELFDLIDENCGPDDYDSRYELNGVEEFIYEYKRLQADNARAVVYFEGNDEKVDISEYIAKFNAELVNDN